MDVRRVLLLGQSATGALLLSSLGLGASLGSLLLVRLLLLRVSFCMLVRFAFLGWQRFFRLIYGGNLVHFELVLVIGGGHE